MIDAPTPDEERAIRRYARGRWALKWLGLRFLLRKDKEGCQRWLWGRHHTYSMGHVKRLVDP